MPMMWPLTPDQLDTVLFLGTIVLGALVILLFVEPPKK